MLNDLLGDMVYTVAVSDEPCSLWFITTAVNYTRVYISLSMYYKGPRTDGLLYISIRGLHCKYSITYHHHVLEGNNNTTVVVYIVHYIYKVCHSNAQNMYRAYD